MCRQPRLSNATILNRRRPLWRRNSNHTASGKSGAVQLVGFIGYMRSIRTALANFECIIDDLIEGDKRVAARMRFRGIHSGQFFGVPATGQEIIWTGAAFFTMDRSRITELWVLGDIDAAKQQLGAGVASSFDGQE